MAIGCLASAGCPGDVSQADTGGGTEPATGGIATLGGDDSGVASSGTPDDDGVVDAGLDGTSSGGPVDGSSSGPPSDEGTSTGTPSDGSSSDDAATEDTGPPPECVLHTDCDPGEICGDGTCVPGCNAAQACPGTLECCDGTCIDTDMDILNCGMCGNPCPEPPDIKAFCALGECAVGDCDPGYFDCDGMGATGCEQVQPCLCAPGAVQDCYPGPLGTQDVGPCAAGTQTCNAAGTAWGACIGYVTPTLEQCDNNIDEDCNGAPDDIADVDGDGWTLCDNDCCESEFQCSDPPLVNPGAFEFVGNNVDDDCDPLSSDVVAVPDCSLVSDFTALTGDQLAEAMDLCQFTTENEPLETRKWGVITAEFVRPDNFGAPSAAHLGDMQNFQSAVLVDYGTGGVLPTFGPTMAGLSSGYMRDQGDPNYLAPNDGTPMGQVQTPPANYVAVNGGLPSSAGCSGNCASGTGANDAAVLHLRIRVPTNALSFSYALRFFTAEYWCWACTLYNDFFLAILESGAAGIPADGNISFDSLGNPISVNNGFFEICQAHGCYTCPSGSGALNGTGMQLSSNVAGFNCATNGITGGGTVWLETTSPIVPGETIDLYLMVFDVQDQYLDSVILLDNWEWSIDPSDVGTVPQ